MSRVHIVKCQGKSIPELIKALEGAIRELRGGEEVTTSATDFYTDSTPAKPVKPTLVDEQDEEEMEPVASPFGNQAPVMGNVPEISKNSNVSSGNNLGTGELDSEGIPWDSRIHASSKAKVSNGTWRTRRGVDDQTLFTVKNELRGRQNTQAPVVQQAPVMQVPNQPTHAMQTPVNPPIPTQQMNLTGGHTLKTFIDNFDHVIAALVTEGKLSKEYIQQLVQHFGLQGIWLASNEQKEIIFGEFVKYGIIQKVG